MATATYTSTAAQAGAPATLYHAAPVIKRVRHETSGKTLSDQILLLKVPNGAIITSIDGIGGGQAADLVFKLGLKSGTETTFGTHTLSSTTNPIRFSPAVDNLGPVQVSLTDGAQPQYSYIYMTLTSGSYTQTFSIDFTVTYYKP